MAPLVLAFPFLGISDYEIDPSRTGSWDSTRPIPWGWSGLLFLTSSRHELETALDKDRSHFFLVFVWFSLFWSAGPVEAGSVSCRLGVGAFCLNLPVHKKGGLWSRRRSRLDRIPL